MNNMCALLVVTWLYLHLLSLSTFAAEGTPYCRFPFIYNDVTYTTCTTVNDPDNKPWCSTRTDDQNNHLKGIEGWRHCEVEASNRQNRDCSGACVDIDQCPALNSLLQQARTGVTSALDTLRKSVCATRGSTLQVCCNGQTKTSPLPSKCGLTSNNDKIVNGENANFGSWPWMVIFRAREIHDSGGQTQRGFAQWTCGGVLITDQYVLSSAHCFSSTTQVEFVRIGEYDLSKNPDTGRGLTAPQPQDITVDRIIRHPSYGSPCQKCNDIALVKLTRPAQLDKLYAQPICLPSLPEHNMGYPASALETKTAFTTGWGVTEADNIFALRSSANILQQANLTIQEQDFCRQQKTKYPARAMILCAGQGDGKDTCRGDSGGPLMITDSTGLKWYTVGITSFGATICGSRDSQSVFTSVHYYIDWIKQNIL